MYSPALRVGLNVQACFWSRGYAKSVNRRVIWCRFRRVKTQPRRKRTSGGGARRWWRPAGAVRVLKGPPLRSFRRRLLLGLRPPEPLARSIRNLWYSHFTSLPQAVLAKPPNFLYIFGVVFRALYSAPKKHPLLGGFWLTPPARSLTPFSDVSLVSGSVRYFR